jgi:hypothetical protein
MTNEFRGFEIHSPDDADLLTYALSVGSVVLSTLLAVWWQPMSYELPLLLPTLGVIRLLDPTGH